MNHDIKRLKYSGRTMIVIAVVTAFAIEPGNEGTTALLWEDFQERPLPWSSVVLSDAASTVTLIKICVGIGGDD